MVVIPVWGFRYVYGLIIVVVGEVEEVMLVKKLGLSRYR